MRLRSREKATSRVMLDVVDVGCGAGTQSAIWAKLGHRVHGIDINQPLVELASERAKQSGLNIDFRVGSAVSLPWPDGSMDVCLLPELLEHVGDWKGVLHECARLLRPDGVLFLSTTNKLCPLQQEFNLPLYSWYPAKLKRYFENLAQSSRPDLANFAKYPAVNWLSFYSLRRELDALGFLSLDRFDVMDLSKKGATVRICVTCLREVPLLRWLGHVITPFTVVFSVKLA
ncbi:MAG: class I SAM-dependent methyltransferase [Acidobacteria bacterium]|nr:class I SAM-dependent methyltransferase [Acidobacteriota bacterium]MCI0621689.1 class I SAM-dependent methyltransferase [Acidobacteriota bacterium]MCI0724269.1 class I SAM-dependent methyltransferase [Acidobacteriota bacterium]